MLNKKYIPSPLIPEKQRERIPTEQAVPLSIFRVFYLAWLFFRFLVKRLRLAIYRGSSRETTANLLRRFLEKAGGIWIKLGQILALRTDLFPASFCDVMAQLQDRATGFPSEQVFDALEQELGRPLSSYFQDFDPVPIAAASLGQVHRAWLWENGIKVAVKIQRPYARDYFSYDMFIIKKLFNFFIAVNLRPDFRWGEMLVEINRMMDCELDYRLEASFIKRMKKSLKDHGIYVPKVFFDLCSKSILVMEFVEGVPLSDYVRIARTDPKRLQDWLETNQINPRTAAKRLIKSLFRQIFEDNLFHGDLHPGNIMLLRKSKLVLVDFGNVGFFERDFLRKYYQYLKYYSCQEYEQSVENLFLMTGHVPRIDLSLLKTQIINIQKHYYILSSVDSLPFHQKSISSSTERINKILFANRIDVNWGVLQVARTFSSLDLSIFRLHPDINYNRIFISYFAEADRRRCKKLLQAPGLDLVSAQDTQMMLKRFMNQRAVNYLGMISHGYLLVGNALKAANLAIWVFMFFFIYGYLFQHHPELLPKTLLQGRPMNWVEKLPALSGKWLALILMASFLARRQISRLAATCLTPLVKIPEK